MEWGLFIKGFVIGFSIAAPVGPIGILCIQRTLSGGNVQGLVTGLGAATADALYGFIAAFGLTFISNFLVDQSFWFRIIGGFFLCYLATVPSWSTTVGRGKITSVILLTLTNPMTILFFAGIFAGLGIVSESIHYASAGLMVIGVFTGSGAWWLLLSGATGIFRNKISEGKLAIVNKISGCIIGVFGIVALISAAL
jgi:threonine/homoserine/homoserine lactone efflux protein